MGGVTSFTLTINERVELFPAASVAMHVTVVIPIGNLEPDGGFVVTVAVQLSVTVTEKYTVAESSVAPAFTTMVAGVLITGD